MTLALGKRDPCQPTTTFLETKLCLGTYAALQEKFMGKGSPFADQVLSLRKTMDIPKVFGTCNRWDDHRCRQLIWALFDEGVTYCGCRLTPDDFFQPKEITLSLRRNLHWKLANWRDGRRWTNEVSQRSVNGTIIEKIGTNTTMHHKQSSAAEVAGLDMKICVTMG